MKAFQALVRNWSHLPAEMMNWMTLLYFRTGKSQNNGGLTGHFFFFFVNQGIEWCLWDRTKSLYHCTDGKTDQI